MLHPAQRAYAQFCALPKEFRGGVTDEQYAEVVAGNSVETLKAWKRMPEFKRAVAEIDLAMRESGDYEAWCMYRQTIYAAYDNFDSLNKRKSKDANIHSQIRQWAKVIQSMSEHAYSGHKTIVMTELSDVELIRLVLREDLNAGLSKEDLAKAEKILTTRRERRGGLSAEERV